MTQTQTKIYFELKSPDEIDKFDLLVKNSKVCVIDFYAKWCGPCKTLAPVLEKKVLNHSILSKNVLINDFDFSFETTVLKDKIVFLKVDVDNFDKLASTFDVSSIPHIVFYKDGVLCPHIVKGNNSDLVISMVEKLYQQN